MTNESFITECIRTSLGYDKENARKYSILECSKNEYLDPEFDPFALLHAELFVYRIRANRGITA